MRKLYQRRSGGVSKTLIFSDLVTTAGAVLTALVESGVLSTDSWAGPVLLVIGLITRVLRQTGPKPQPVERDRAPEVPKYTPPAPISKPYPMTADDYLKHGYMGPITDLYRPKPETKTDDTDERL
jgi:hypothetical protein